MIDITPLMEKGPNLYRKKEKKELTTIRIIANY
jgi:hypothetical protein